MILLYTDLLVGLPPRQRCIVCCHTLIGVQRASRPLLPSSATMADVVIDCASLLSFEILITRCPAFADQSRRFRVGCWYPAVPSVGTFEISCMEKLWMSSRHAHRDRLTQEWFGCQWLLGQRLRQWSIAQCEGEERMVGTNQWDWQERLHQHQTSGGQYS